MQILFTPSFEDFLAAQRLHAKHSIWSRFGRVLRRYIFPAIGLIFLAFSILFVLRDEYIESASIMFFLGLIFALPSILRLIRIRRRYRRTRSGSGECEIDLSEDRICTKRQYSKSEVDWKAIHSFSEDGKVFLLYLSPAKTIIIPKRVCSETQVNELRALLSQKVQSPVH